MTRPAGLSGDAGGTRSDRAVFIIALVALVVAIPPLAAPQPWQQAFATTFHAIVLQAFPFLILGSLVAGLIDRYLPGGLIPALTRRLGRWSLLGPVVLAPAVPVCECGVLPVARSLMTKGLPLPHTLAFLIAAPILNPTVLLTTWLALGDGRFVVLRALGAVVIALLVGLVALRRDPLRLLRPEVARDLPLQATASRLAGGPVAAFPRRRGGASAVLVPASTAAPAAKPGWTHLGRRVVGHFTDMSGYFLVGVLIAAALKTLVPPNALEGATADPVVAAGTMMGSAFILSLCAEVDAFIAASFTGFPPHAVLAFLVFGPLFDIKLLLMYRSFLRDGAIAVLAVLLTGGVLAYALACRPLWGGP